MDDNLAYQLDYSDFHFEISLIDFAINNRKRSVLRYYRIPPREVTLWQKLEVTAQGYSEKPRKKTGKKKLWHVLNNGCCLRD